MRFKYWLIELQINRKTESLRQSNVERSNYVFYVVAVFNLKGEYSRLVSSVLSENCKQEYSKGIHNADVHFNA